MLLLLFLWRPWHGDTVVVVLMTSDGQDAARRPPVGGGDAVGLHVRDELPGDLREHVLG